MSTRTTPDSVSLPSDEDAARAQRRALLTLIGIGGVAVLGSYALVFDPAVQAGIWGGVPESLKGFYTLNMLMAAASFFPATLLLGFKTDMKDFKGQTGLSFQTLLGAYAAILMPSAAWLPLTAFYIQEETSLLWLLIRIDLLLVGFGATAVAYALIRRAAKGPALAWGAVVFFFFFWLQTMVLDAIIWPWYYHA